MSTTRISPTTMVLLFTDGDASAVAALLYGFVNNPQIINEANQKYLLGLGRREIETLAGAHDESKLLGEGNLILVGNYATAVNIFLYAIRSGEEALTWMNLGLTPNQIHQLTTASSFATDI